MQSVINILNEYDTIYIVENMSIKNRTLSYLIYLLKNNDKYIHNIMYNDIRKNRKYTFFYKKELKRDIYPMIPSNNILRSMNLLQIAALAIDAPDSNIKIKVMKDRCDFFTKIVKDLPSMIRNYKLETLLSD